MVRETRVFKINGEFVTTILFRVGDRVENVANKKKGTVTEIIDGGLIVTVDWDNKGIMGPRWLVPNLRLVDKE